MAIQLKPTQAKPSFTKKRCFAFLPKTNNNADTAIIINILRTKLINALYSLSKTLINIAGIIKTASTANIFEMKRPITL